MVKRPIDEFGYRPMRHSRNHTIARLIMVALIVLAAVGFWTVVILIIGGGEFCHGTNSEIL